MADETAKPPVPVPPENSPAAAVLFRGSCACGRITYACTALPTSVQACHCITCRKISGGAYQAFADVPSGSLAFHDNAFDVAAAGRPRPDRLPGLAFLRLSPVAERVLCAACHASLAMQYGHLPAETGVTLGSVDEASLADEGVREALKLRSHIFVSQKCWWIEVGGDGLPLRDRFGGDWEQKMEEWHGMREG